MDSAFLQLLCVAVVCAEPAKVEMPKEDLKKPLSFETIVVNPREPASTQSKKAFAQLVGRPFATKRAIVRSVTPDVKNPGAFTIRVEGPERHLPLSPKVSQTILCRAEFQLEETPLRYGDIVDLSGVISLVQAAVVPTKTRLKPIRLAVTLEKVQAEKVGQVRERSEIRFGIW